MLRTSLLLALFGAITPLRSATEPSAAPAPTNPSGFAIHRGTNLSHWFSQDFGWVPRAEWTTENDLRFIASLGFDHVRLPVDEIVLWKDDGAPDEAAFAHLDRALGWCRDAKLRVILDLHSVRAHDFNADNNGGHNTLWTDPAAQEHFVGLWRQLSERFRKYPVDFLAYEIMNEPTAPDPEDWNRLVARTLECIRSAEPARVVVLGGDLWQIPQMLPLLKVPAGDRNIILSMHTYMPMMLTHHGASWVPAAIRDYTGPVAYPGPVVDAATIAALLPKYPKWMHCFLNDATEDWGPARLRQEYEPAIARARELGLQLYCGEFGCLPSVPRADRLAYYRDVVGVFEAAGMAWANWEYKGDFGIAEWLGERSLDGAPDVQLLDALFQR